MLRRVLYLSVSASLAVFTVDAEFRTDRSAAALHGFRNHPVSRNGAITRRPLYRLDCQPPQHRQHPVAQLARFSCSIFRNPAQPHRRSPTRRPCTPNTALRGRPTANNSRFCPTSRNPGSLNSMCNRPAVSARKLTSLTGFLDFPRWSPDGKKIAILFTENAPRAAGPLEPSTKESGVIEEHIYEQRLTLVDPASGKSKPDQPGRYLRLRIRLGSGQRPSGLHRRQRQRRQQLVDRAALHNFTHPPAKFMPSTSRRFRSRIRAGPPTGSRSPSSAAS